MNLDRCAIHTMTFKPWSLATCCERFAAAGVPAISVWRNVVATEEGGVGVAEAARVIADSGLRAPAYVRGGFFTAHDAADRRSAIDLNRRILDEAAALGARMVVLVVGATPGVPLAEARRQVTDGIADCVAHADAAGVGLVIEPLHPMYAGDKSCVNRIAEARSICDAIGSPRVGVAVDTYHVWWDPDLAAELAALGRAGQLMAYHVCDWRVPTRDLLTDRALMGDGCIDLPRMTAAVEAAGFAGDAEVEIFSEEHWSGDLDAYLERIATRFREAV